MASERLDPRLLIIDDDRALLEALSAALHLRLPSLMVETIPSARDALRRLETQDYGAILSDIRMPDMDGFAFLAALQALPRHPPVVMITGQSDTRLRELAHDCGALTFIEKPFEREDIVKTVARLLGLEPAAGADRTTLAFICEAYAEDEAPDDKGNMQTRVVMRFHPRLAPIKAAVFPLVNKQGMPEVSERLHRELGIETLADLEIAARDGRLGRVALFGAKRLAAVRQSLAIRLGHDRWSAPPLTLASRPRLPTADELLGVDAETAVFMLLYGGATGAMAVARATMPL